MKNLLKEDQHEKVCFSCNDGCWEENLNGKFFRVTTKEVQNGKVKRFIKWKYVKHGQEMWRYETNQMGGTHMTTVSPGDQVFAFCMKRIGWQYRTEELWCY